MVFPAGLEPATFRVLGGRDNHYTTETTMNRLGPDTEDFSPNDVMRAHRGPSLNWTTNTRLYYLLTLPFFKKMTRPYLYGSV